MISQAMISQAMAQSAMAALVAKPVALPDMALGSAKASVTITEFASMSCPHCAAFEQNVFPMIRSKYIDTGKIRYVFREFPLDIKAAAASMVARCMAGDDAEKFFGAIDVMFKQQDRLMTDTQDDPETDRRPGRLERRCGGGLRQEPGDTRQALGRREIRQRDPQGRRNAELFHQWRDVQGRDVVRGNGREDQNGAEEITAKK